MGLARRFGMVGVALMTVVVLSELLPATAPPSRGVAAPIARPAQAPACVPVPQTDCGSVRVPLFWSDPAGPAIDVAYALVHHRDAALPTARGTVVVNPGGPG